MKSRTNSQRVLILLPIFIIINSAIYIFRLTAGTLFHSDIALPKIQGFVLKAPQQLTIIHLIDHQGKTVNQRYFIGKWHFITYGYTHCPDICPTTLLTLTRLADLLNVAQDKLETQFVFYTIDPNRASQKIIAQYIHYFSEQFVAMRADTLADAESFQQSLAIKVEIIRSSSNKGDDQASKSEHLTSAKQSEPRYLVNHGLAIFLINPDAQLQAGFLPKMTELGMQSFSPESLYRDYLHVINYYQQHN